MKRIDPRFSGNLPCIYQGYIGEAVEQEETLCDDVVTVMEFAYPGGGCEVAVTARTRCGGLRLGSVVSFCMARDFL